MRGVSKNLIGFPWKAALGCAALVVLSSCGGANQTTLSDLKNSQVNNDPNTVRNFDTGNGAQYTVLSRDMFEKMVQNGEIDKAAGIAQGNPDPNSLVVGFPKAELGTEHFFGAVVIATDGVKSTDYGDLKLTDLPPMHVYPTLVAAAHGQPAQLQLLGCMQNCQPNFTQRAEAAAFPVAGTDSSKIYVDFSKTGDGMNLIAALDPQGQYFHLKGVNSHTIQASYTPNTLTFDVLGEMVPVQAPPAQALLDQVMPKLFAAPAAAANARLVAAPNDPASQQVAFTTRWYLQKRLPNPNFKPQVATPGVGFFMTERFATPHVEKHELVNSAGQAANIHYFIKDVPDAYKSAFQQAFEDWNDVFQQMAGNRLLTYEFVDSSDQLASALVTGDVRTNVVEWDLVNLASYGGLGPSEADQANGQIITSNILIQGPTIIQLYTEWFGVNREAQALRDSGQDALADNLLRDSRNRLYSEIAQPSHRLALAFGDNLAFKVNGQDPRVRDTTQPLDFEILPSGVTYDQYMYGYFRGMVAHELGHNMGLRHNFKGNLLADDGGPEGKVSSSIMEYLGRSTRFKQLIASYDLMAINWGYEFKAPSITNNYCTDEDQGNMTQHAGSAECSLSDDTNNPYQHFLDQFARVRDLLVNKGSALAPVWTMADIQSNFTTASQGILLYGESAQRSMSTWQNFFQAADRPAKDVNAVKSYVVSTLASVVCEPGLEAQINSEKVQGTAAAATALANLSQLRQQTLAAAQSALPGSDLSSLNCGGNPAPAAPMVQAAQAAPVADNN